MSAEELIERLKKFPSHYQIEVWWDGMGESDDLTAEIIDVQNFNATKTISLEMATRLLPEPK